MKFYLDRSLKPLEASGAEQLEIVRHAFNKERPEFMRHRIYAPNLCAEFMRQTGLVLSELSPDNPFRKTRDDADRKTRDMDVPKLPISPQTLVITAIGILSSQLPKSLAHPKDRSGSGGGREQKIALPR
jgi:hypothetical protein